MTPFGRMVRLFLKHWPTASLAFSAMIVVAIGTTLLASLVGALFDSLAQAGHPGDAVAPTSVSAPAIAGSDAATSSDLVAKAKRLGKSFRGWLLETLPSPTYFIPALLVGLLLIKNLAQYVAELLINRVGLTVVRDLRQQLYESILGRSVRFFTEHGTGELSSRVLADVQRVQESLGRRFGDLLQDTLTVIVLTIYVFVLHTRLAVVTLIIGPPVIVPILRLTRRLRRTATRSQEQVAKLTDLLQETIRGQRIVKAFGMEGFEIGRFREANDSYFRTLLKEVRIQATSTPLMEAVAGTGMVAIFAFAQHEIAAGRASLGTFTTFTTALALLYQPLKRLNKGNLSLQQALAAAERVFGLLDLPDEVTDAPDAVDLPGFESSIRLRSVEFEYHPGRPVLQGIDLEIRRGEVVAFVGASGSGKSTLVHLVPRFYDPTRGGIEIDGVDLRRATQRSVRALVGLVTQDIFLFNDSIRRNVCYGRDDLPDERLRAAARAAHAADFVEALPEGYETVVGEAGVRLSGGQKQRIAIARAILKDPPILILDEATSALDVESERVVQQALENLMRDRTTLVVAHRLSTIRRADRIVVLQEGRIVEIGNHDELLELDGHYARLHRLHAFGSEEAREGES